MSKNKFSFCLVLSFCCAACFNGASNIGQKNQQEIVKTYLFSKPDMVFDLPGSLVEISGLSYDLSHKHLIAHNDEEGKIFTISPTSGEIVNEEEITGLGDFEGIAQWKDTIVMIKSKGDIIVYDRVQKNTTKINTVLKSEHNIEGLWYDQSEHRLLLAGKGEAYRGAANEKALYSYSLNNLKNTELELYHTVNVDTLNAWFRMHKTLENNLEQNQKIQQRILSFAPSSIAVHPLNQRIYLTSSRGKSVVVLNEDLSIHDIILLDKTQIEQPEGLCFSPDGTLYLCSEGKKNPGRLFVYSMHNSHDK